MKAKSYITAAILAAVSCPLSAQTKDITSITNGILTKLKSLGLTTVDIVLVLIGLVGLVMCIPTAIRHFRNDPSSQDAFLKLGGGIVIVVLIVEVIRQFLLI